jgi:hypothetical protein
MHILDAASVRCRVIQELPYRFANSSAAMAAPQAAAAACLLPHGYCKAGLTWKLNW